MIVDDGEVRISLCRSRTSGFHPQPTFGANLKNCETGDSAGLFNALYN